MEVKNNNERRKRNRAKKRVEDLKGFYWHFASYLFVNLMITTFKIVRNLTEGETFDQAFFDFGTFAVWFFWGIGLFFHAMKVFSIGSVLGKDWEERQIQKYIEKEKEETAKYQ